MSDFLNFDKSKEHIKKSSNHLAGGVNSTFRTGMKPNALSFISGKGAYLFDVDGNKLIVISSDKLEESSLPFSTTPKIFLK